MLDEDGYSRSDGYKGPGLKIGIGVVLALLVLFFRPTLTQQGALSSMSSEQGADQALTGDPEVGDLMTLINARFPEDYRRIQDAVRQNASARDMAAVRASVARLVEELGTREGKHLAQASDEALGRLVDTHFAILDEISFSPPLCVRFLMGVMEMREPLEETRPKLRELPILRLTAMADGRDKPVKRSTPVMDGTTTRAVETAVLGQHLGPMAMEVLTGKRAREQASHRAQCDAERGLLRAMRTLPPAQRARAYAGFYGG